MSKTTTVICNHCKKPFIHSGWWEAQFCSHTCANFARYKDSPKYKTLEEVQIFMSELSIPVQVIQIQKYKFKSKWQNSSTILVEHTETKEQWITTVKTLHQYWTRNHQVNSPSVLKETEALRIGKIKETNLKRYGTTSNLSYKDSTGLTKSQQTCIKKYGVDNPWKTKEFQEKGRKSIQVKYGVRHYSQTETHKQSIRDRFIKLKANPELYKQYLETAKEKFKNAFHFKGSYRGSKAENAIRDWLTSITNLAWAPDLSICHPKHLDMYEEKYKIAIEYNSLMWHNEHSKNPRGKLYHRDKYRVCKEQGIQLLQVWDYMWNKREKQIKNHIKALLGISEHKIPARKTVFKGITKQESDAFLEENHIQGKNNLDQYRFGLFYDGILVGVITFGRHHRKSIDTVLNRLCFKDSYQVVGGASKLFKNTIKHFPKGTKIVSWSENNWSHGKIYQTLGFTQEKELPPTCAYTDRKLTVFSLQSQQKHLTGCPKDVSQSEWALKQGLSRFWDSGKLRWGYTT